MLFNLGLASPRGHDQMHDASFGPGRQFHKTALGEILRDIEKLLLAQGLVGHLATTKAQGELHPLAVFQKLLRLFGLTRDIVDIGAGPDA